MPRSDKSKIESIIHNRPLASALVHAIETAKKASFADMDKGKSAWDVFETSLKMAIRDIESHELGKLFLRFIEYGPHNPDDPEARESDGRTILSDPECGTCVEFIFSYMINRFKGELAELLALEATVSLVKDLKTKKCLPPGVKLYWGDAIKERRRVGKTKRWGSFAKGADELIVEKNGAKSISVHGVVEVKSMVISEARALRQVDKHIKRLSGGLKLHETEWPADSVRLSRRINANKRTTGLMKVMVIPSSWKLSREWSSQENERGRVLVFPQPTEPPVKTSVTQLSPDSWCIRLAWSEEALNQAAYEMTFWYMSQVGKTIYEHKELPKGWESMSPTDAGYNAVKMMLNYIPLRIEYFRHPGFSGKRLLEYKRRIGLKTIRLYNVYSFGYPLGIDAKDMLWPEDFPEKTN